MPEDVASWMGSNDEAWIFYGEQEMGLLAQYMELGDRVSLVGISSPARTRSSFTLCSTTWSGGTSREHAS